MRKIRILWLSNKVHSNRDSGATGTWLDAMADGLLESGQVELANIAIGSVRDMTRSDCGLVQQWLIPIGAKPKRNGLPAGRHVAGILKAVEEYRPDLVHIWGTESFWGLLSARKLIRGPALLEMQGLKTAIAKVYAGGLSFREQLACIGVKEVLRCSPIWQGQKRFQRWGRFEREIIRGHQFVTVQSDWLESQIRAINPRGNVLRNEFALRKEFLEAQPWQPQDEKRIFCSVGYPSPFKGGHVAIRALALLKPVYPGVQLHIAGAIQRPGLRQEGYVAWLNREARRLGVEDHLHWLGLLPAQGIVAEIQHCAAVLLPTFVEGYCLALAEAMLLGAPCVVSFVGGTSYLARDDVSALFFPPGDAAMCAYQVERVLTDKALAQRFSSQARAVAMKRNDPIKVVSQQLDIYREIISKKGVGAA